MRRLVWIAKWAQSAHLQPYSYVSKIERCAKIPLLPLRFEAGAAGVQTGKWPVEAVGTAKFSLSLDDCLGFSLIKIYPIHLVLRTVK